MDAEKEVAATVRTLVTLLAPAAEPGEEVTADTKLIADLGFHSLALLELGCAVEELFEIGTLAERLAGQVDRVGDVELLLGQAVAQGEARIPTESQVADYIADYRAELAS